MNSGERCPESALEGSGGRKFRAMVGQGFQDAAGPVRALFQQDRQGVFQRGDAVVVFTIMPIDAVQKRGHFDEFVSRVDELEIQQVLFARRHGRNVRWELPQVNREGDLSSACGGTGDGVRCGRVSGLCA